MNDLIIKTFIDSKILPEEINIKDAVKLARLSYLEGEKAGNATNEEYIHEIVDAVINNRITKMNGMYFIASTSYTFEELMTLFKTEW
jgi:hypothetical protein